MTDIWMHGDKKFRMGIGYGFFGHLQDSMNGDIQRGRHFAFKVPNEFTNKIMRSLVFAPCK